MRGQARLSCSGSAARLAPPRGTPAWRRRWGDEALAAGSACKQDEREAEGEELVVVEELGASLGIRDSSAAPIERAG